MNAYKMMDLEDYKLIFLNEEEGYILVEHKETAELSKISITDEVVEACMISNDYNLINDEEYSPSLLKINSKIWNENSTLLLISQYRINEKLFQNNKIKNEVVWKKITTIINNHGFSFSTTQVINKWKHLRKLYIKEKDNMGSKASGAGPFSFKYFEEIDAIFCNKPNVVPTAIASSSKGSQLTEDILEKSFEADLSDENRKKRKINADEKNTNKKPKIASDLITWMEDREVKREENRQKRHEEVLQNQKEVFTLFKNIMEKFIDKM